MYSSLALFKQYINVEGNDKDELLQLYLDSAGDVLNRLCGVTSFNQQTYEERVEAKNTSGPFAIYLHNKPVTLITKFNGEVYLWENGKDYIIVNDRKVIFSNFQIPFSFLNSFLIEYTAGYTSQNLPASIKIAEMNIAWGLYAQSKNLWGVQSYKLWDEQVTFATINGESPDVVFNKTKTIINQFRNFKMSRDVIL